MLAKYIGEGQYLRVLGQTVWGSPIICRTMEDALKLPLHDKGWLGVAIDFVAYRNPCYDAVAMESERYVEYESDFILPTGEKVARVHPKRATHVIVSYPLDGKTQIRQLTIEEYEKITVPNCPYCQSQNTYRAGQKTTTQSIAQQWRCGDCGRRFQH